MKMKKKLINGLKSLEAEIYNYKSLIKRYKKKTHSIEWVFYF